MIVNHMCESFSTDSIPLQECYLVNPVAAEIIGLSFSRATVAHLSCGQVHRGDLVWMDDNSLAEVMCFFGDSTSVLVFLSMFTSIDNNEWIRSSNEVIRPASSIMTAVSWVKKRAGVVWVLPPNLL